MDFHIYMEGGGDSVTQKAMLRLGMDAFLKDLKNVARERRHRWNLVPCGGRDLAWKAFYNAPHDPGRVNILLVDAEDPVLVGSTSCQHLLTRDPSWTEVGECDPKKVFLMVQCMETLFLADPEALKKYYGQQFNENSIPRSVSLETVLKSTVYTSLDNATKNTQKGTYGKIRHASELLRLIDCNKVRAKSPEIDRLFVEITQLL